MNITPINSSHLQVQAISTIEPESVSWLWHPYIPLGKLTMLEGDPESGKTYLSLAIAAAVTNGAAIPTEPLMESDANPICAPANVLYITAEDGLADTLRPRFDKLGGNPSRLLVSQGLVKSTGSQTTDTSLQLSDIAMLEEQIALYKVTLVVIDPLQAFIGGKIDLHRANEIRPILSALAQLAERQGCAMLIIRHLNKGDKTKALYRGLGSIDVSAAARSILLTGKHPQQPGQMAMVHLKCSVAAKGPSLGYSIHDTGLNWEGPIAMGAEALLTHEGVATPARPSASAFLGQFLRDGSKSASEVTAAASSAGYSKARLKSAREALGVLVKPSGYQDQWFWSLPVKQPSDGTLLSPLKESGGEHL